MFYLEGKAMYPTALILVQRIYTASEFCVLYLEIRNIGKKSTLKKSIKIEKKLILDIHF